MKLPRYIPSESTKIERPGLAAEVYTYERFGKICAIAGGANLKPAN